MPKIFRAIGGLLAKAAYAMGASFSTMDSDAIRRVFGSPSAAGKSVDETSALTLAVCWACQRILSETIGCIPWAIYRNDGPNNAVQDDTHPLAIVLRESPNRDMTPVEFREAMTLNLAQAGNAYAWKETLSDQVVSLTPLEARAVQPKRYGPGVYTPLSLAVGEVFYSVQDRGQWKDYPREKIWHVKGFGGNGYIGLSPLGAAKEALGLALATDEFGARFFAQGGLPSGIVTVDGWLTAEQRTIARENLQQLMGGLQAAHKFALFEGKMKPEAWGNMNLEELQFLMLRKFSVEEICRYYRIPPHMVANLDKATFSNIEHLSQEFVTYTLMPYFTRYEASAARWLLAPKDRSRYFLRFNADALLRGDTAARKDYFSSAVQNGWLNRNEVRAKENMNRVDGLDEYTAQTNLAPVEDLGALAEAAAKRGTGTPPAPSGDGKVMVISSGAAPQAINVNSEISKELATAFATAAGSINATTMKTMQKIEHAVVESTYALTNAVNASAANVEAAGDANAKSLASIVAQALESNERALKELTRVSKLPRKAVLDPKTGEPIGTVVVDQL